MAEQQRQMVDAQDPQFTKLGDLYKTISAQSTNVGPDGARPSHYDALIVPPDVPSRQALLTRLLDLFSASSAHNFKEAEFANIRRALESTMPNPEKDPENFAHFVTDRCHGVLEMLRLLVSWQGKKPMPSEVAKEIMQKLAAKADDEVGVPVPVSEFTGQARDDVMHPRVERIKDLRDLPALASQNQTLKGQILQKLGAPFAVLLDDIYTIFDAKSRAFAAQYHTPQYLRAQWFNTLLRKIWNNVDIEDTDAAARMEAAKTALTAAETPELFMKIINGFAAVQQ